MKDKKYQIFASAEKEINQSDLFDCARDSFSINSIINSTAYFDLSNMHRSLSPNHRINPINYRDLFEDDFIFES